MPQHPPLPIVERTLISPEQIRTLAALRIAVFREWPYLYDGDIGYENSYLRNFMNSEQAALVLAHLGDIPVGMATASPLTSQSEDIQAPLRNAGIDLAHSFYFGESVLLPEYHGLGVGHRFFEEREAAAREAGALTTLFCAVVRPDNHPLKPAGARDLAPFWRKRGYTPLEGVLCSMSWKDRADATESAHPMQFWMKTLA